MKVAVVGGSGFIGSRFLELYKNELKIIKLDSNNAPLDNYKKLLSNTENCDVIVHSAFDHNYKSNIIGIKNILKVCKENNIKKLIYLSSFSVYDLYLNGDLTEKSSYSKLNDPYSIEKRKIEKIIDSFDKTFDVIILQPSIVYGIGGNWSKYAFHICKSKKTFLPYGGEKYANIVYVDDVANAIKKSIESDIKYEKFLISGEIIKWKDFYCKQCEILREINLPSVCNIQDDKSKNKYHTNIILNFVFILWYHTFLGKILNKIVGALKKLRAKNYGRTSSQTDLINFLEADVINKQFAPIGITRKVHNTNFVINTAKARNLLNFTPMFTFENSLKLIRKHLQEVIK